jgi:hypothetical protein
MSRIVFHRGDYYEEFSLQVPVENGEALFRAQLEHDIQAAHKKAEKTRKQLFKQIANGLIYGFVFAAFGSIFLWLLVRAVHWFWFHPIL